MKYFFIFILIANHALAFEQRCEHSDSSFRYVEYLKNYDGDTITFKIKNVPKIIGENISVRVKGVDTPEIKGKLPCEKEVARITQKLVHNLLVNSKQINLVEIERDKYFRILADVEFDGKHLSEILIKNKLAYPYQGKTKEKLNWCGRMPASLK